MEKRTDTLSELPGYKIGVASRLSGIPTHTLRKWEERYDIVKPFRTLSGGRVYDDRQVRYLARLKQLVDAGMDISDLARRSEVELDALAQTLIEEPSQRASERPRPRVLIVGPHMPQYIHENAERLGTLDVRGLFHDAAELAHDALGPVDIVILEVCGLTEETKTLVERMMAESGAAAVVVLYRFGPQWARAALSTPATTVMRLPVKAGDLQRMVLGAWYDVISWPQIVIGPDDRTRTATPRFSQDTLVRISSSSAAMRCECPNHIADLLIDITAFERYSADCEVEQPADAEEHRHLRATAASARMLFEDALSRLASAEGIPTGKSGSKL